MRLSWRARLINLSVRYTTKRLLGTLSDPVHVRRGFARSARFWLRPLRGTVKRPDRLKTEGRAPVPALWVTGPGACSDQVVLYLHGGAFIAGSAETHSGPLSHFSALFGGRVCLVDYRLAPEHPFPAACEDALTAYKVLLARGTTAESIVLGGESAGGNLVLGLLARIRAEGLPMPACAFALSPSVDMTFSSASIRENAATDDLLPAHRVEDLRSFYLSAEDDPATPFASPVFAEFEGSCPVYMTASDVEILRDDARRMAESLKAQGVDVTYHEREGLVHGWPLLAGLMPEADETLREIAEWVSSRTSAQAGN